jgi:sugar O-acyltransferase (sialic acid O-acetyltransferase NeuD family)
VKRLLIIGGGGHGRAIAEAATGDFTVAGFLDDGDAVAFGEWQVLGRTDSIAQQRDRADAVIVAIGNNRVRAAMVQRVTASGFNLVTVVHPRAIVAPSARIGRGSAIMAGAVVGTEAVLGEGVIVNSGGVVDHHCRVEPFGHVGTNAAMAGGSVLGEGAWLQAGAALGYGVHVSPGTVLAPGEGRSRSPD